MMSDAVDLTGFGPENVSNDNVTVTGRPNPGQRVDVTYNSNAGGAWNGGSPTISGELLYVTHNAWDTGDRWTCHVHDPDEGRTIAFSLKEDSVSSPTIKSLAASRTNRGRKMGSVTEVDFTAQGIDHRAPAMDALRSVIGGDTLMVNGAEYGVRAVDAYGPDSRPDKYRAHLTTADGDRYSLTVSGRHGDGVEFVHLTDDGREDVDVDPATIRPARFREDHTERPIEMDPDTEDTTDAFPAPHGVREGERVTFTLHSENGDGSERVTGTVTDVRYYTEVVSGLGSPGERDPMTKVQLDDGRDVKLSEPRPRLDADARAWVNPDTDELDDSYMTGADDIQPAEDTANGGGDGDDDGDNARADGGKNAHDVVADGGVVQKSTPEDVLDAAAVGDRAIWNDGGGFGAAARYHVTNVDTTAGGPVVTVQSDDPDVSAYDLKPYASHVEVSRCCGKVETASYVAFVKETGEKVQWGERPSPAELLADGGGSPIDILRRALERAGDEHTERAARRALHELAEQNPITVNLTAVGCWYCGAVQRVQAPGDASDSPWVHPNCRRCGAGFWVDTDRGESYPDGGPDGSPPCGFNPTPEQRKQYDPKQLAADAGGDGGE